MLYLVHTCCTPSPSQEYDPDRLLPPSSPGAHRSRGLSAFGDLMGPPRPGSPPGGRSSPVSPRSVDEVFLSRKIDADELVYKWMSCWEGWIDECMRPDYRPVGS